MREPGMTRRHFELIAHVINALDLGVHTNGTNEPALRLTIAHDFARVMEGVNQSFNREMFINACTQADRKRAEARAKRASVADLAEAYGGSKETVEKLTKRAATGGDGNWSGEPLQDFKPDDKLPERAR